MKRVLVLIFTVWFIAMAWCVGEIARGAYGMGWQYLPDILRFWASEYGDLIRQVIN